MMSVRLKIIMVVLLVLAMAIIVNLIRKRKLELKYALVWMLLIVGLALLVLIPGLLEGLAALLGIYSVHFVILDKDIIAPSNINRQAIAFHSTIGKRKVDVMEAMIRDINPAATVIKRTEYLLSDNIDDFFASVLEQTAGKLDYVVDAIDTISAKLTIAKYAQDHDIRLVSSMGGANKLHPECLRFADIFDTVRDPMSRIMRKECKKRGIKSLHVLFSCEESVKTQPRDPSNIHERTELGTASFMPPIMGQMIAGEVIRQISGRGTERVRADGQRLD